MSEGRLDNLRDEHGRRLTTEDVDRRIRVALAAANRYLAELGIEPIGETPYGLRRAYEMRQGGTGPAVRR